MNSSKSSLKSTVLMQEFIDGFTEREAQWLCQREDQVFLVLLFQGVEVGEAHATLVVHPHFHAVAVPRADDVHLLLRQLSNGGNCHAYLSEM